MKKIIGLALLVLILSSCGNDIGGVAGTIGGVQSSQNEKERDSNRMNDLMKIRSGLEIFYSDMMQYPTKLDNIYKEKFIDNYGNEITTVPFLKEVLSDNKEGEIINGCTFGYIYEVFEKNGIPNDGYRLSTCLENKGNIELKAKGDGGIYDDKFEIFN